MMRMTWLAAVAALLAPGAALAQETAPPVEITAPTEATATPGAAQTTPTETAAETPAPALPLGAWVQLEIVDALTSNTATIGQQVALRVAEPVMVDGVVVIPAGTSGVGEIIDARRHAMAGMPGSLVVASRHLDLNDQKVALEGMIVGSSGQGFSTATAAAFIGPGAAFIPGRDIEVAAGARVSARIAGGSPEVAAPVEGRNPVPSPPPGKALVVFYQLARMGTEFYTYGAGENGVPLARLRGNQYAAVAVDPGLHEFEVLAPMGGRRTGVTLRQEILEGQIIFIRHNQHYFSPGDEQDFTQRRLRTAPPPTAE